MLLQFIINGLITGLLYSLLAIGFALVYNTTHIFHIAAAGIYVFAAYMFWLASGIMPIWLAFIFAAILSAGLSYLIDVVIYLPLKRKKASLNIALVSSIGVMTVIVNVLALIFGNESKSLSTYSSTVYDLRVFSLSQPQLVQVVVAVICLSAFFVFFSKNSVGQSARMSICFPVWAIAAAP